MESISRRYGIVAVAASLAFAGNILAEANVSGIDISVLSGPPEFVTGGAALVEIVLPSGLTIDPRYVSAAIKATINGLPVPQGTFNRRYNGQIYGLLSNLSVGDNVLEVHTPAGGAQVTLTNYPKTNGVLVAPYQPIICRTVALGLGPSTSADCDAPTQYLFLYKSTDPTKTALQPYDPSSPASDVAQTTTDQGVTVPFIVRNERGVVDRYVYDIAVLFDPSKPWTAIAPQPAWNHKVFWRFQGGALPGHFQAANRTRLSATTTTLLARVSQSLLLDSMSWATKSTQRSPQRER